MAACDVQRGGDTIVITGSVPYNGARYEDTWSMTIREARTQDFFIADSGTVVRFRAVDVAGRGSTWVEVTVTVD